MEVRIQKPSVAFTIKEFERGVKLRFGKSKGIIGPGLHLAIPRIDEVRIVDIRPRQYEASFDVLSQDNYPLATTVDIRYKISNAEDAVVKAPENFEGQIDFLLKSESGKEACKNMTMDSILKNRDELGRNVQAFLDEHVGEWGIDIETVQVKEVVPPSEVPELQTELYDASMKRIIEPVRAGTEAEVYRTKAGAKLEMMKQYLGIITDVAGELAKQYGAKEARDIMYILFGKTLGYEHPVTQKIRTKMGAEGMGEGAASAAESIGADPKYTYLMTTLQNMKGIGIFDIRSFDDLADLDKQLNQKLYPK